MKKDIVGNGSVSDCYCASRASSLVKAISLSAVMTALLSSVSPVVAAQPSSTAPTVQNMTKGVNPSIINATGVNSVIGSLKASKSEEESTEELTEDYWDAIMADFLFTNAVGVNSVSRLLPIPMAGKVARAPQVVYCGSPITSLCLGPDTAVEYSSGVALGESSYSNRRPWVKGYDPKLDRITDSEERKWSSNMAPVSVGNDGSNGLSYGSRVETRQIIGVAAGSEDTDAVNLAQLKALREWVGEEGSKGLKQVASSIGGGAKYDDGKWTDPTFTIVKFDKDGSYKKEIYNNVGAAFVGVDGALTELSEKIDGIEGDNVTIHNNLIQQEKGSKLITIGGKVEGDEVSIANQSGGLRKLSGIKDGELSDKSTDAVNGQQLYDVKESVKTLDSTVSDVKGNVTKLDTNISEYLGGDANILKGQAPTYTVQGKKHNNVGAAFVGVDGALTELSEKIDGIEVGSGGVTIDNSLIQQEKGSKLITIGGKVEGNKIDISNSEGNTRTLSGVKAGKITEESTDAVNGQQLYDVKESVKTLDSTVSDVKGNITKLDTNISEYLGGDANILKGQAPTYTVQGKKHNNVGAAFVGVDGALTELSEKIDGIEGDNVTIHNNLIQQEKGSKLITIGGKVEGNKIDISNSEGNTRTLSGVKAGKITEESTDAVNGQQLYDVKESVKTLDSTVSDVKGNVTKLDTNISEYLGGDANILKGQAPTYTVQGKKHNNVGAAFVGVDGALTELSEKIDGIESDNVTIHNNLIQQEKGSKLITIGGKVEGDEVSIANQSGGLRKLSGIKDGELSDKSTDAVSGKQLYNVQESVKTLDSTVSDVKGNVTKLDTNISEYLGGDANILKGQAPTYTVQGKKHNNVGAAFVGVDGALTELSEKIDGIEVGSGGVTIDNSLIQQEKGSKLITIGGKVEGDEVSIANQSGGLRKLSGIKDGELSDKSTDAVNGQQLYDVKESVKTLDSTVSDVKGNITKLDTNISEYLGGDANILKGQAPTYTVQGKKHNNVGAAFVGVDDALTELSEKIDGIEVGSGGVTIDNSLIQQEKGSKLITIGGKVEGNKIDISNSEGNTRTLSGVKAGKITEESTDAVNGQQLYDVKESVKTLDSTVSDVKGNVTKLDTNISEYLGGDANILKGQAPTYTVQGKKHNNVGAAFVGVDGALTELSEKIDGIEGDNVTIHNNLIQQEKGSKLITIGGKVEGDEVSIANQSGGLRKLSGIKDGELSDKSTDAVSGKQLYNVQESVKTLDSTVSDVKGNVTKLDTNISEYLGGDANILKGQAPTYTVQGKKHNNVGAAFVGVDGALTELSEKIDGIEVGSGGVTIDNSLIQQEKGSKLITIGGKVEGDEVSIANQSGGLRKLSGIKDGELSDKSTDAVNGQQLYDVKESVKTLDSTVSDVKGNITKLDTNISEYLGGDANILKGQAPTYTVQGKKHNNVGAAFVGVDDALTELSEKIDGIEVGSGGVTIDNSLIQQEKGSKLITIGGKVEGNKIDISNSEGNTRTLSGVKAGKITEESTDAVNGQQLYDVKESVKTLDSTVSDVKGNVTKLDTNISEYLGGDANILKGQAPTYTVQGKKHNNVGAAFVGVDGALTELSEKIDGIEGDNVTIHNNLIQQEKGSKLITIGGKVEGDEVSIANQSGGLRKLSGIKDGELSDKSTDAVSGKQLYNVQESVKTLDSTVSDVKGNVTKLDTNISEYLGGDANILKGQAPTYTVQGKKHNNVGAAFVGVDGALTELSEKIDGIEVGSGGVTIDNSLIQQEKGSKLITIGGKVEGDEVSIANQSGGLRKLSGIKDGELSDKSTDAVSGKQLYNVQESVKTLDSTVSDVKGNVTKLDTNISEYLGGDANILKGQAPTYTVQGKKHNNVGAAFVGVDGALTELSEKIDGIEVGSGGVTIDNSLIQQEKGSKLITIGGKVEGNKIDISNSEGNTRTLSGVKAGKITEESTDAVNGQQLYDVKESVKTLDSTVSDVKGNITKLDTNISEYLGGDANILKGQAPTYTVQGKKHNNVGAAFVGVDGALTELSEKIDGIEGDNVTIHNNLIQQEKGSKLITIGGKVEGDEVSIANQSGGLRKLSGIKDGELSDKSTDAVSGKQLYNVQESVKTLDSTVSDVKGNITKLDTNISEYLGGDANILKGQAPTYTVQGKKHNNVGAAFVGVDDALTELSEKIDGIEGDNVTIHNNLVQQEKGSKLITIGGKVEGNKIDITNNEGDTRILSGVKDGKITEASTDAVNGKQLYDVKESVKTLNGAVSSVKENVITLDTNISEYLGGGANILTGQVPTYTVQGKKHNNVGAAFVGVDETLTQLQNNIDTNSTVVKKNALLWSDEEKAFVALHTRGGKEENSKLKFLLDGDIADGSTEAITGNQLYSMNNQVASYLGGGSGYNNGQWTDPTFNVVQFGAKGKSEKQSYHTVADAFEAVNSSMFGLSDRIEHVGNQVGSNSLNWNDDKNAYDANHGGQVGKITNVANGAIEQGSSDAVTGHQLHSMNNQLASYLGGGSGYNNGQWTDPTFNVVQFGAKGKSEKQGYHTVADAFEAVNNSMSGLSDRIEHVGNQVNSNGLNWDDDKNAYDASHDGQAGKITNVANGAIEQGSSDAVTGHQLWETNEKVNILENKVDSMTDAVNALTDGIVSYDKDEYGNKTNTITLTGGSASESVVINNVADGKIEEGSKQAINGGQVYDYTKQQMELILADANKYTDEKIENMVGDAIAQTNKYTDMKFETLNSEIENTKKEARQAAAIGLAVSNLRYDNMPGQMSFAFGGGLWRSQSAIAVGAGYTSENGRIRSNLSATTAGGHWGVGAGVSWSLK
ncbi:YadA-like family protein [Bartonella sp. WD16.2]|uniref:YadA-like family protein n=1 Tax=Bartonella sp. WD16.2 TaxID=1933904 RepID=UPI00099A8C8E|nr:YadA-like family protein [Bartonella sp. WD16.2]AQX19287.1 Coiled stalk of trimeric autotransporter adhesin [Bartonella sp. WD16.2]